MKRREPNVAADIREVHQQCGAHVGYSLHRIESLAEPGAKILQQVSGIVLATLRAPQPRRLVEARSSNARAS